MNYGNVIIVGNGGCLLNSNLGEQIDSYDYVVRMGECRISGYEKDVGKKTDMYRMKWFNAFNCENNTPYELYGDRRVFDFTFKDIMFIFQDPDEYKELSLNGRLIWHKPFNDLYRFNFPYPRLMHDKLCEVFNFNKYRKTHFFSSYLLERLKTELYLKGDMVSPSAGLCTIYYFLKKIKYKTLTIVGFDGFVTGHYWKPEVNFSCSYHRPGNEKFFLTKLVKNKQIYDLCGK